ncbi:CPBP family intramembrane glutamic endopeptidase [Amycolatopsis magusensis]|uniref:Membrane protease YdiL (CAAX protease family) n=1 Tax=Amycolatopsis magusensis TaxID=882444 RepID=A0ABS4PYL9_9PSEU|nr:type II CAAX endopeptidase family protein [Amycolatopsis magusensis]MBP2184408.1 membrane protease YdiL (CAAX protease family) [Amycolatopsis magusensis]
MLSGKAENALLASVTAVGGALLRRALAGQPASPAFYRRTTAVAAVWLGGSLLGARPRLEYSNRGALRSAVVASGAFAAFATGALVIRRIPALDRAVGGVLTFATTASSPAVLVVTLANGAAEELFFRGTWFERFHPAQAVAGSTVVYVATTAATGNPALVLAAVVMGTLFGVRRHRTGGVLEPLLTHLFWSILMVQVLPHVHGAHRDPEPGR